MRLAARLGPRRGGESRWSLLAADRTEIRASLATSAGNATRAAAIQDRLRVSQQHADSVAERAETRANSYATLLLAVAAGMFAGRGASGPPPDRDSDHLRRCASDGGATDRR